MNGRKTTRGLHCKLISCTIMLAIGTGAAFAADAPGMTQAAPSKEVREKMASMHEQMAACLRSDKSVSMCHTEMMKRCHDLMGEKGCQMMGMHDHMMKDHPTGAMDSK